MKHRRFLAALLAVCMMVSLLPSGMIFAAAADASAFAVDDAASYVYRFSEVARATLAADQAAGSDATSVQFHTDSRFSDYSGSQIVGGNSAPWMFYAADTSMTYYASNKAFGTFFFTTAGKTTYVKLCIKVAESGWYFPSVLMTQYGSTATTDLSIAPIGTKENHEAEQFFAMRVPRIESKTVQEYEAVAEKPMYLPAGEYIATFRQKYGKDDRYLTAEHLKLGRVTDGVWFDEAALSMAVGESRSAAVTTAASGNVRYQSSASDIVSVSSDGTLTAHAAGSAEITATCGSVSAACQVTVCENIYEYRFGTLAQMTGVQDLTTVSDIHLITANSAWWTWADDCGTHREPSFRYVESECDSAQMFQGSKTDIAETGEWYRLKISVEESGTYVAGLDYDLYPTASGTNVYLAPCDAQDPMADSYHLLSAGNKYRPVAAVGKSVEATSDEIALEAGEYYLTFEQYSEISGTYCRAYLDAFSLYQTESTATKFRVDQSVFAAEQETSVCVTPIYLGSAVPADQFSDLTVFNLNTDVIDVTERVENGKLYLDVSTLKEGNATVTVSGTYQNGSEITSDLKFTVLAADAIRSIELIASDTELEAGDQIRLSASVARHDGSVFDADDSVNVAFYSSDSDVLTVTSDGLVSARAFGTATVSATVEHNGIALRDSVEIKVTKDFPIASLTVSGLDGIALGASATYSINGYLENGAKIPSSAVVEFTVVSDPNGAISLSKNGTVLTKALGEAVIAAQVTMPDGSVTKSEEKTITVYNSEEFEDYDWFVPSEQREVYIDFKPYHKNNKTPKDYEMESAGWEVNSTLTSSDIMNLSASAFRWQIYGMAVDVSDDVLCLNVVIPADGYYRFSVDGGQYGSGVQAEFYMNGTYLGEYNMYGTENLVSGGEIPLNTVALKAGVNRLYIKRGPESLRYVYLGSLRFTPVDKMPTEGAVDLRAERTTLSMGESLYLLPGVQMSDGTVKRVGYTGEMLPDENNRIVSVTADNSNVRIAQNYKLCAVSEGTSTVTMNAVIDGVTYTKTLNITVDSQKLTSLTVVPESSDLYAGQSVGLQITAKLGNGRTVALDQLAMSYTSSDENIAKVVDGELAAYQGGSVQITASATLGGTTVSTVLPVTILGRQVNTVEIDSPYNAINIKDEGYQLKIVGTTASQDKVELPDAQVTWSTETPDLVSVSESGFLTPKALGKAVVCANVVYQGETYSLSLAVEVRQNKTKRTYYNEARMSAVKNNIENYEWAQTLRDNAAKAADTWLAKKPDMLEFAYTNMMPSQQIPRGITVGHRWDPTAYHCKYCGEDLRAASAQYPYLFDSVNYPWKIQCPLCRRRFPSNDFESFYKTGIDEHGNFNYVQALENGQEYLVNTTFPEKPEDWAVDDSRGYRTGNHYQNLTANVAAYQQRYGVDISSMEETWTFIGYYAHFAVWNGDTRNLINAMANAYLYTGDKKYGRVGAILTDRLADLYPEMFVKPWFPWFFNSDSTTPSGKMVGCIWQTGASSTYATWYDAFYDMYDDPEVISYLSQKAADLNLDEDYYVPEYDNWDYEIDGYLDPEYTDPLVLKPGNPKTSGSLIRQNIEDNLLREILASVYSGNEWGNFGTHQQTGATAAVVLDSMPETGEMIDWLMQTTDETCGSVSYIGSDTKVDGGDIIRTITQKVRRDGSTTENAPGYGTMWPTYLYNAIYALAGYDGYEGSDLLENPKLLMMYKATFPMLVLREKTLAIGDSDSYHSANSTHLSVPIFMLTEDVEMGQLLYWKNGNTVEGLNEGMFEDSQLLQEKVQAIIDEHGEYDFDKSEQATGWGLSIVRNGTLHEAKDPIDTQRFNYIYYGGTSGHGHPNKLDLGLAAFGIDFAPDFGYPEAADGSYRATYRDRSSTIHNVVLVNDKRQTSSNNRGFPLHFNDSERVSVIDARDLIPYAGVTKEYRRSAMMIEVDDKNAYTIDFFRVVGGNSHVYSFHANSNTIASDTLDTVAQKRGTYAGENVEIGGYHGAGINSGYDFFYDVRRASDPGTEFTVDFLIDQFRGYKEDDGYHLKMTMLNDFALDEVALAKCQPPQKMGNPEEIEFVLARREGSNLDSLFTTVFEPYQGESYIASQETVPIKRIGGAWETVDDAAKALKITLKNGRVDYVVYATNKDVRYNVDGRFEFQGFVGVYMLADDSAETPIYAYINDGTKIGDLSASEGYTGRVVDFTKETSIDNSITVKINEAYDADDLVGEYIYVENDGVDNGVYEIEDVEEQADGTVKLKTGMISFIRGMVDEYNVKKGYTYNIAEGQHFTIPKTAVLDNSPIFEQPEKQTIEFGDTAQVELVASLPSGDPVTFELVEAVKGASIEGNVLTFKPSTEHVGKTVIGIAAKNGSLATTVYWEVEVLPPDAKYSYKFSDVYTVAGVQDPKSIVEGAEITDKTLETIGSDRWVYVSGTFGWLDLFQGMYLFANPRTAGSSGGDVVRVKITVEEDGKYYGGLNHRMYGPSAAATVYLAPVIALNPTDEEYRVLHATNANRTNEYIDVYTLGETVLNLKAGEYYLTFVQTDDSGGDFRYFIVRSFHLIECGEYETPITESLAILESEEFLTAGTSTALTAMPYPTDALPGLVWTSLDESVAIIDPKTGVITPLKEGEITVMAETTDGSNIAALQTFRILAKPSYDYKFKEIAKKLYLETGSGKLAIKEFANNYEGSALVEGGAPWCYISAGTLVYLGGQYDNLGVFTFGAEKDWNKAPTDSSVFKIKISENGQYTTELIYNENAAVTGTDIYIAPVLDGTNKTAPQYLALRVSNADRPTDDTVVKKALRGTNALNLAKGEYYVTFVQTNDATSGKYRYLYLDNLRLHKSGEYVPSTDVMMERPKDQLLSIGDQITLSAATITGSTHAVGVNWSSSDETVATVDAAGVVTAVGTGQVIITASAADDSGFTASVSVLVHENAQYDYKFKAVGEAMVAAGAENGEFATLTEYTTLADSSPWKFVEKKAGLFTYLPDLDKYGPFFYNGAGSTEWIRIKIKLDESGVYSGAILHNHTAQSTAVNVFFAPVTEVDAGADPVAEKYKFIRIEDNWTAGNPETGFATVSDSARELSAGEYYVTFVQNTGGDKTQRYFYPLNLQLFRLDNTVSTTNGAAIRITGKQGIRFYSQIDRDFLKNRNVVEYGMVLMPTTLLGENELTIGYTDPESGKSAAKVPAKNLYDISQPNQIVYTAVITNTPASAYKRAVTARAYAILEDGTVIYGNCTSRSIYQVAQNGLASGRASAAEKAVFEQIVADADAIES